MAAKLVTIYWRDIPAQVSAQLGRTREPGVLDARFERDIDRAAMVAGLTGSDDYLTQWRRTARSCGDDLAAEAAAEAERIEAEYPRERVNAMVGNGGWDPDTSHSEATESGAAIESAPAE